jgi:hypothetical protein
LICPNCGASNSARATFCRRCHQRLPVPGLAAGVTYPRRRAVTSGNNRLPIIAALALAIVGLVIGAMIVSFARPGGNNGPVAVITPTPGSTLPTFTPEAVSPSPSPSSAPIQTFQGLPTPVVIVPTDTPLLTIPPSIEPTVTPTFGPPTPTPPPTKKPTPTPTKKPTPTPTPTTPQTLGCANITGAPDRTTFVGTGNSDKTASDWCLQSATFRVVTGSMWGSADLTLNGKTVASFTCGGEPNPCSDDTKSIANKYAKAGAVLSWRVTSCVDSTGAACTDPSQFMVTIEVGYQKAVAQ